jgi:hypothetical protein
MTFAMDVRLMWTTASGVEHPRAVCMRQAIVFEPLPTV